MRKKETKEAIISPQHLIMWRTLPAARVLNVSMNARMHRYTYLPVPYHTDVHTMLPLCDFVVLLGIR